MTNRKTGTENKMSKKEMKVRNESKIGKTRWVTDENDVRRSHIGQQFFAEES